MLAARAQAAALVVMAVVTLAPSSECFKSKAAMQQYSGMFLFFVFYYLHSNLINQTPFYRLPSSSTLSLDIVAVTIEARDKCSDVAALFCRKIKQIYPESRIVASSMSRLPLKL